MPSGAPRRRRARPVADAPVDALLLRVDDLAKGWLLALLEHAPLDDAPAILAAELAQEGPRVCDAVVRALADDRDLRRLEADGALEPLVARVGELAGTHGAEATVAAVDALGGVIWSALRAELPGPEPEQISDLAERLSLITEVIRGAALRRAAGERDAPLRSAPEPDELRAPAAALAGSQALWIGAVADEISRSAQVGLPLSLLLVELEDADRVRSVEEPAEAHATLGRFAQALRSVVRRQDILACETDTRAWVIARETARPGARSLAARIASAVADSEPWRGAPLKVSVGVSVLGEDGRDAGELIDAAEEAKFAAEARGVPVAGLREERAPEV